MLVNIYRNTLTPFTIKAKQILTEDFTLNIRYIVLRIISSWWAFPLLFPVYYSILCI